ncbi:MAG: SprT family zinc-dependent metalloprotease [Pseudomonadota bacterium]
MVANLQIIPTKISLGEFDIPISIRISRQARRISIKISPTKNSITMTLPKPSMLKEGLNFIKTKQGWIEANTIKHNELSFINGSDISILGKKYQINNISGRGITNIDEANSLINVYGDPQFIRRRITDYLKKIFLTECINKTSEFAKKIDKSVKSVRLINAKSRWGSCNAEGDLSFNWLLAFAPYFVFEYVIAHEVSHLALMNHSPKFWQTVENLFPETKKARHWLKKEGYSLHV